MPLDVCGKVKIKISFFQKQCHFSSFAVRVHLGFSK